MSATLPRCAVVFSVLAFAVTSCAHGAPADRGPSATMVPARVTAAEMTSDREPPVSTWRTLSLATTRALATDEDRVYFGDESNRALFATPKVGGPPIAVGAPAPRAIALVGESVMWIAERGNALLRASRNGGPTEVVRGRGDFTALAAAEDAVYLAERTGNTGVLTRIAVIGSIPKQVAVLDAPPSALAVDESSIYALTSRAIFRIDRASGRRSLLFDGAALSRLALDADAVYTTAEVGASRAVLRVPKTGGERVVLEHAVRDAPIARLRGDVYYFADDQPTLRRVAASGGASAIVARAPELGRVTAMAADASGIFVGSESAPRPGRGEQVGGAVIAMPVPAMEGVKR